MAAVRTPLKALSYHAPWANGGERFYNGCSNPLVPYAKSPQAGPSLAARSPLGVLSAKWLPPKSPASADGKTQGAASAKSGAYDSSDGEDDGGSSPELEEAPAGKPRGGAVGWKVLALVALAGLSLHICVFHLSYRQAGASSAGGAPLLGFRRLALPRPGFFMRCPDLSAASPPGAAASLPRHYPMPVNYSRGACACAPVHNFVILSMQRSGSGWFETLLNNHPNISSHGEVFSVRPRRQNFAAISATLARIYNLDWRSSASKDTCTAAVGLKWMLNQGAMEYHKEVRAFFDANRVSIVLLLRRNVLRRLVSILANAHDRKAKRAAGLHKSHVHSRAEAKELARFRPLINAKHLRANLQRVQQIADDALRVFNGTRLRVVYYEDVVRSRQVLDEVQDFLGVPRRPLESLQVKIHTRPLKESVQNWEEVQQRLKGTEFEAFTFEGDYHS